MQPVAQAIRPLLHSTFHRDQLVETAYLLYVCIFVDSAMPDPASRDQTSQSAHLPLQNIHSIHSMHNNRCIQVFQELCSGNSYLTCIHISHPLNAVDAPHMFLSPQGPRTPQELACTYFSSYDCWLLVALAALISINYPLARK